MSKLNARRPAAYVSALEDRADRSVLVHRPCSQTSLYYRDPNGIQVERRIDNFATDAVLVRPDGPSPGG